MACDAQLKAGINLCIRTRVLCVFRSTAESKMRGTVLARLCVCLALAQQCGAFAPARGVRRTQTHMSARGMERRTCVHTLIGAALVGGVPRVWAEEETQGEVQEAQPVQEVAYESVGVYRGKVCVCEVRCGVMTC